MVNGKMEKKMEVVYSVGVKVGGSYVILKMAKFME